MITSETGVYLQFFDEGESFDAELPPIGPFELLIIRHNRIIGDRENVEHDMLGSGSVERWLEAELELRRALGDEPGGIKRAHMRIRAPRGDIIVRFYDYAGDEPPKVPELGPFYAVTVGKREVRADDKLLAIRATRRRHRPSLLHRSPHLPPRRRRRLSRPRRRDRRRSSSSGGPCSARSTSRVPIRTR